MSVQKPTKSKLDKPSPLSLELLLRRPDIWRGQAREDIATAVIDSGYRELNDVLQHGGWPLACLIEACQNAQACDWWLFHPAIRQLVLAGEHRHIALLNPPALPFISGLEQLAIPTKRLLVIQASDNSDFIACFNELCRSCACPVILAWQPKRSPKYSQLRKLQLSAQERNGLYVIFRPLQARYNSSPAGLRLIIQPGADSVAVQIFKQRGQLRRLACQLPIPETWRRFPAHCDLQNPGDRRRRQALADGQISHIIDAQAANKEAK